MTGELDIAPVTADQLDELLLALMNDLYVDPAARGQGIGRVLIDASVAVARERGAHHLQWVTAADNERAQRLYDSTGAHREPSIEYELEL